MYRETWDKSMQKRKTQQNLYEKIQKGAKEDGNGADFLFSPRGTLRLDAIHVILYTTEQGGTST